MALFSNEDEILIEARIEIANRHRAPSVDQMEFSSYYSATIFMFAWGSAGVALSLIPLLLYAENSFFTGANIYELIKILRAFVLICLCVFLIRYKRRAITRGSWTHNNTSIRSWLVSSSDHDGETHTKYMMFTLLLFGIGSIACCILKIVEFCTVYSYIAHSLNIVALACQLVFFYDFISDKLPNVNILHYSISAMIGIKIWSWVGAVIEPLWDESDYTDNVTTVSKKQTAANTEFPSYVLEFSEEFFEPFYVEFSTMAVGVLFSIWHSMKKGAGHPSSSDQEFQHVDPDQYNPVEVSSSNASRANNGVVYSKKIIIVAAVFTAVAFTVISILATVDHGVFEDLTTRVYVYRGVTLLFFSPLMVLAFVLLLKLNSVPSRASSFLNSSEYVLLFTACSESIYYILRAFAAIGYLTMTETPPSQPLNMTTLFPSSDFTTHNEVNTSNAMAVLFLVYSVVKFAEAWLQSKLLIVAPRKHLPDYVRSCLTFMVAVNFSEWLKSGILLGIGRHHRSSFNPMMDIFYGPDVTVNIIVIFLPIMILFRFHAAIIALEIINES